jgi:flavin-dependent dehydrogenase
MSKIWDVGVVGGGPAGLAAAIALQSRGLRAIVVDGMRPPIDKACGEGLMPGTVAALHRLGVHISADRARRFSGIGFIDSETHAEGDFPEGSGLAVRRTVLHEEMVARAEQCGVAFRWGTPVTAFDSDGLTAGSEKLTVKWIVGADGARSRVRRWAGLDVATHHESRYAYRRHYRIAPWSSRMEIHWGPEGQAYVTALGPTEVCVAVVSRDPGLRLEAALAQFPELRQRIGSATPLSAERGATTSMRSLRRVCRGNVVLVGDASGSVDAITGEGLGLAFHQAEALADAVECNDLPSYQEAHGRIAARPSLFARLLLLLDRQPWLRRRVLAAMAKGNLFPQLLGVHTSEAPTRQLLLAGARLGFKLLEI